jgi:hypothetical protein
MVPSTAVMLLLVLHVLVLLLLPDTSGCCIETVHKPQLLLPRFTPPPLFTWSTKPLAGGP